MAGGAPPAGVASRRAALQVLREVHAGGAWSAPALARALGGGDLDARDRSFAANLAYQTLRWQGTLDWVLAGSVTRPLERVEAGVLDILRLGTWQLLFGAVPDRAAVGTAVELARAEVGPRSTGFVNAALRNVASRVAAGLDWPDETDNEGLGVRLGYPEWVVAEARARFGPRARAVLEAGNDPPGVTLRATGDPGALLEELRAAGVDARRGRHAPEALLVPGADPGRLDAVAAGRAVVQDEASMLVARTVAAVTGLLAASPDHGGAAEPLVLDACAGPGGKSGHLAGLGARVVAADVHQGRARLVARVAARTGVSVGVAVVDGTRPAWRAEAFDAVLVDAPCTGLGVVRRRPELRWARGADAPERLAELQLRLLGAAAGLVRPGGVLVYSACTWTVAETAGVARAFLAAEGDRFSPLDVHQFLAAGTPDAGGAGVQLAPDADAVDGMYVLALRRHYATGRV